MPRGRPSTYTPEIAAEICEQLAGGKTLIRICRASAMPKPATVFHWLAKYPEFSTMYARAREMQADYYAAEIAELADKCRPGKKLEEKHVGWRCPQCGKDARWQNTGWIHSLDSTPLCVTKPEKIIETKVVTGDMIERSKLQVDARKFLMAKLAPKRYGDRLELAGDKEAPLTITVRRMDRS